MTHAMALASLVQRIRIVNGQVEKNSLVDSLLSPDVSTTLAFVNAHAVNLCWSSQETLAAFMEADVVLRDGKGMEMLFRRAGKTPGMNMNGTDFIPELLTAIKGRGLVVLGTRDPWLSQTCRRLEEEGHKVLAQMDGFQSADTYVSLIHEKRPEIVLLAQGMPRQEQIASRIKSACPGQPLLIICGGAIVDFLAERFSRAPGWMQKTGIEWLYRLMREPRRLFGRYVIGNVTFLVRAQKIVATMMSTQRG